MRMMSISTAAPVCKSVVVLVARKTLTEGKVLRCQAVLQTHVWLAYNIYPEFIFQVNEFLSYTYTYLSTYTKTKR